MKTLLNKFNKIGVLAVLFAALIITTQSAFKASSKLTQPDDGWYAVTILDEDFPEVTSNQEIDGTATIPAPAPTDEENCAQSGNTGFKCAVHLVFDTDAVEVPATVADVDAETEVLNGTSRSPE